SVNSPQALPARSTSVGRSILPRKRETWRTRLLTQVRSVPSSSVKSCSTAANSFLMVSFTSASVIAAPVLGRWSADYRKRWHGVRMTTGSFENIESGGVHRGDAEAQRGNTQRRVE